MHTTHPSPDIPLREVCFGSAEDQQHTWINGPTDNPAQGVPGSVVKPVVELIEALLCQKAGCTVVKIPVTVTSTKHLCICI